MHAQAVPGVTSAVAERLTGGRYINVQIDRDRATRRSASETWSSSASVTAPRCLRAKMPGSRAEYTSTFGGAREAEERINYEPERTEAIIDGAALRVRPIAMTVAVIIAGLLPIMWGSGTGSEVNAAQRSAHGRRYDDCTAPVDVRCPGCFYVDPATIGHRSFVLSSQGSPRS
jgi:AcrB/AcrD/AcrF family